MGPVAECDTNPGIIVVDDDEAITMLLTVYLERAGYRVRSCNDSRLVTEMLAHEPAGIVLSDVRMPGLDGWEVLRAVKDICRTTVVYLMSADNVEPRDAALAGAMGFFAKPFDFKKISDEFGRYCGKECRTAQRIQLPGHPVEFIRNGGCWGTVLDISADGALIETESVLEGDAECEVSIGVADGDFIHDRGTVIRETARGLRTRVAVRFSQSQGTRLRSCLGSIQSEVSIW